MSPKQQRTKIRDFLVAETDLRTRIMRNIAIERLKTAEMAAKGELPENWTPDKDELRRFLQTNFHEILKDVDRVIDSMVDELVGRNWQFLAKHVGVAFALLVPAVGVLVDYALILSSDPSGNKGELAACVIALLFILCFIVWACVGVFLDRPQKGS